MSQEAKPLIRIAPNTPTFDLPVLVALEEGFFDEAGIEVRYSARYEDRDKTLTEREVLSRLKESLYECGSADTFNLCEWGGIDRIERGSRGGRIAALRAAVTAQAILTFDQSLQVPRDLSGVSVGVNEYTGSHYTTLQMLEGVVGREKVVTHHIGAPQVRMEVLRKGSPVRAVTLMEPFISLALKEGAHILAMTFYRGAEVISPNLTVEQREAYLRAINKSVDHINANFGRYAHYIVEATKGQLAPEELSRNYVRYGHVKLYDPELFDQAYSWMRSWGLSRGKSDHDTLVAS
jgi:ABC-type nitrate/sulfonate/bicarbonate transport system substrate-binding protein